MFGGSLSVPQIGLIAFYGSVEYFTLKDTGSEFGNGSPPVPGRDKSGPYEGGGRSKGVR